MAVMWYASVVCDAAANENTSAALAVVATAHRHNAATRADDSVRAMTPVNDANTGADSSCGGIRGCGTREQKLDDLMKIRPRTSCHPVLPSTAQPSNAARTLHMADEAKAGGSEDAGLSVKIGSEPVPVTWDSHLDRQAALNATTSVPFQKWAAAVDPELDVSAIHIQGVDMFGRRVGFVKFRADVSRHGKPLPGIVFMRGGAVAILVILSVDGDGGSGGGGSTGAKESALLTLQPRVPIGKAAFAEIPAGMLDGDGHFAGVAAKVRDPQSTATMRYRMPRDTCCVPCLVCDAWWRRK